MITNTLLDKLIKYISQCKIFNIVTITTSIISFVSIPVVYIFSYLLNEEYTDFLIFLSIILPLIITPVALFVLAEFSKHLKYYKQHLEEEIEKNHTKDLMLFEQARFVLMGEMMANISHQWKQPLNNVGLSIVSSRLTQDFDALNKNFDIMEKNINYLSNTINDFMSFFENKIHNEARPIGDIVDEVRSIMEAQIKSCGIKLSVNIDEKLKKVKMTPVISQVLLNLLNNAKDARDDTKINKEIVLYFEATQNGFLISCCDNGVGIDKAIVSKIFDPYFTTKDKKQGTGIGLYMSKQIVTKIFDGTIVLDERTNSTCFKIEVPCSKNCQFKQTLEANLL